MILEPNDFEVEWDDGGLCMFHKPCRWKIASSTPYYSIDDLKISLLGISLKDLIDMAENHKCPAQS